ncbi:hypothetical protein C8J55DRAFT_524980 [Lentinula edodes]|uniref:Uncharacterized protein n=1 Tax=Lentinula lateritia TaxID=40482 RepID=A0A9W8ZXR5_9AGAR|nr:hypothetical protein C8J55DRAFT_524980 [Lentinula edodes]
MDALRVSDSLMAAMKRVKVSSGEDRIATLFSNDTHNSNSHDHCVRVLGFLPVPEEEDEKILVMVRMHKIMDPRFRTVGEAFQFIKEMIEGLHS